MQKRNAELQQRPELQKTLQYSHRLCKNNNNNADAITMLFIKRKTLLRLTFSLFGNGAMEAAASFLKRSAKKDKANEALELSKLGTLLSFSREPYASKSREEEDVTVVDREKLKNKVVNATINVWHNVKYGRLGPARRRN